MLAANGWQHTQSRVSAPPWAPYKRIRVDSGMVKLLKALWKQGVVTRFSCECWNEWSCEYNPYGHFTEDGKVQVVFTGENDKENRDYGVHALRELLGVEELYPVGWCFHENYLEDLFVYFPRDLLVKFNDN
jgi:hypothetical protein